MIHLKKIIIGYIKKLFSDVHSAIVGSIITVILLSIGGIYLFTKNLWTVLLNTIQLPTPLWVTIVLVFVVSGYVYLKQHKKIQSFTSPNYEMYYFTIGNHKWETKIYKDGSFEVERYPLCVNHDLRFINLQRVSLKTK